MRLKENFGMRMWGGVAVLVAVAFSKGKLFCFILLASRGFMPKVGWCSLPNVFFDQA